VDRTSLSPGRFWLRAGIFLVPAASDPVSLETMRNAQQSHQEHDSVQPQHWPYPWPTSTH